MFWVSYFRANHWHTRLFYVWENAVKYADSFPFSAMIHTNVY
jgi:hypothetical protein